MSFDCETEHAGLVKRVQSYMGFILYEFDAPKASGLHNEVIAMHCAIVSSTVLLAH